MANVPGAPETWEKLLPALAGEAVRIRGVNFRSLSKQDKTKLYTSAIY